MRSMPRRRSGVRGIAGISSAGGRLLRRRAHRVERDQGREEKRESRRKDRHGSSRPSATRADHRARTMPRSWQILRASASSISVCRGTAERRFRAGLCHQECRAPSRSNSHPFLRKCRRNSPALHTAMETSSKSSPAAAVASRRFSSSASRSVTVSVSSNASFVRSWQFHAGNLCDPADPPGDRTAS